MSLSELQQQVNDLVRDRDQVVSAGERDRAILAAVDAYTRDRPRSLVVDVVGDGTRRIDLPAGWVDGISQVDQVEYPIGSIPATFLDVSLVAIYRSPSGSLIELPSAIPDGSSCRVQFTAPHVVTSASCTVPSSDRYSVAALAAAMVCEQLAAYYATESAPTIGADTVDHASKSQTFAARAKSYRSQYQVGLGIVPNRIPAASAVADLDNTAGDGGPRIYHRRGLVR